MSASGSGAPDERIVDWALAERLAVALAGQGPVWDGAGEGEIRSQCEWAVEAVRRYTALRPRSAIPAAELIGRAEWVRANIESFRAVSAAVERRLSQRIGRPGRAGGVPRAIAAAATGVEVGLTTGYLAQRVIGQYDVALLGPARPPRLLLVAPNLAMARRRLDVDLELFGRWVALHEATHAVQFAAVPWLREHLGGIAADLLSGAAIEIKPSELLSRLARLDVRELIRSVAAGDLVTLLWPASQRQDMERLLAAMTVVEGYAEHVMDAVGGRLGPGYGALRRKLEADRERRRPLDAVLSKLLGLDLKLAQYRRGKVFADRVAAAAGIRALNRVWSAPEALPSQRELDHPGAWIERVGAKRRRRRLALLR